MRPVAGCVVCHFRAGSQSYWQLEVGTIRRDAHCHRMSESSPHALVMVVDDDVLERMGASYMLSDAGYRVIEAGNADQAMQLFETTAGIGLLFTDVNMPGSMSGADLARQVAERWPGIGIILASGRPRPDRLPSSMRFHEKPYRHEAVLQQAREMTALQ